MILSSLIELLSFVNGHLSLTSDICFFGILAKQFKVFVSGNHIMIAYSCLLFTPLNLKTI